MSYSRIKYIASMIKPLNNVIAFIYQLNPKLEIMPHVAVWRLVSLIVCGYHLLKDDRYKILHEWSFDIHFGTSSGDIKKFHIL